MCYVRKQIQLTRHDKRKWEDVVETKRCNCIHREESLNKIINQDEWYITLWHYMLSVGKGKNYSCSNEFLQIICPLDNNVKTSSILVRFLESKCLKLISITETSPYKSNPRFATNI